MVDAGCWDTVKKGILLANTDDVETVVVDTSERDIGGATNEEDTVYCQLVIILNFSLR
jgi:hypothetical protein